MVRIEDARQPSAGRFKKGFRFGCHPERSLPALCVAGLPAEQAGEGSALGREQMLRCAQHDNIMARHLPWWRPGG